MTGCFLCPADFVLAPNECLVGHLETCHKVQRGHKLMAALFSVGDQGRQMVQCQHQAFLHIKVEPKETLEEVKEEEGLKNLRWSLAEEEEENQRKWAAERERRMALDYYVDMALTNGGVPKNSGRKRKRKSEAEEEGGGSGTETRERKPRKPRKARAPRKPRDRLG